MIISENRKPTINEFKSLMQKTDATLNAEAIGRDAYYSNRSGIELESDVYDALCKSAKGTAFEGSIQLVSGASFPDIVANKYYGVEVKSTKKNNWKSIGSSILESTRITDVERIFLTFGKLRTPVEFRSRAYEECLSGISVTHYPRYQIDMELGEGETIFDKMGVPYDTLRRMENPVVPVSDYYRSQLKPGERLWWAADNNIEDKSVPATVRLWTTLSPDEKNIYTVKGYALFPEILGKSSTKYHNYALWLATSCGIINTNIRDQFSAGGKVSLYTPNGVFQHMPAAFGKIDRYRDLIIELLLTESEATLCEYWKVNVIHSNRIEHWCQIIAHYAEETIGYQMAYSALRAIFNF